MKNQKGLPLFFAALLILAFAGCGGGGGGGGGGVTYNYTVTSANFFPAGVQVATIRFGFSGTCSNITGITADIQRVGAGTVTTPGTVSYSFTTTITRLFVESVYIDNNASGNLDSGDRVWGENTTDLAAGCFEEPFSSNDQVFDWEDVAEQIRILLRNSQASVIYTGSSNSFSYEPDSETQLNLESIVIFGDGYNNQ